MKYIAGILGFLFIIALYWIGGGEFERSPSLAFTVAISVWIGGSVTFLASLETD